MAKTEQIVKITPPPCVGNGLHEIRLHLELLFQGTAPGAPRGRFVPIGPRKLLKRAVCGGEAANIIFIASHTTIPVSRVLDTLVLKRTHCILMEYMPDTVSLDAALRSHA